MKDKQMDKKLPKSAKEVCKAVVQTNVDALLKCIRSESNYGRNHIVREETVTHAYSQSSEEYVDSRGLREIGDPKVQAKLKKLGYTVEESIKDAELRIPIKETTTVKVYKWFFFKEYKEHVNYRITKRPVKLKVFKISWCCGEESK